MNAQPSVPGGGEMPRLGTSWFLTDSLLNIPDLL